MEIEEKVNITWEGQPGVVVIREITWKEKTDAVRKSVKEVQRGRNVQKEVDGINQKELMMVASIKSAPFTPTVENLGKLSCKDGEKLFSAYSKMNELTEEDEEGEEQSVSGSGATDLPN